MLGGRCQTMTYCAAPGHAPDYVVVVADRTPLSDSSSASSGTHPGTCSLRPPFNTTLLGGRCQTITYCAAPGHAPDVVVVVADRTPLSDSSSASSGTHPGTCSLRPPFNTTLLGGWCQTMTSCAAPGHAPDFVVVVADRTPLSDSSSASSGTHPGTCSLRPPFSTTALDQHAEPGDRFQQFALLVGQVREQGVGQHVDRGLQPASVTLRADEPDQRPVHLLEYVVDDLVLVVQPVHHRSQPWVAPAW